MRTKVTLIMNLLIFQLTFSVLFKEAMPPNKRRVSSLNNLSLLTINHSVERNQPCASDRLQLTIAESLLGGFHRGWELLPGAWRKDALPGNERRASASMRCSVLINNCVR